MAEKWQKMMPILVMLGVAMLLAGCGASSPAQHAQVGLAARTTADADSGRPATDAQEAHGGSSPHAAKNQVVIDNFTFSPPRLTVPAGTKVTWINRDDVPHTATSTAKPRLFNSGALDTDEQFSFVFMTPGTYEYFCAVHPKMTGQIIVK